MLIFEFLVHARLSYRDACRTQPVFVDSALQVLSIHSFILFSINDTLKARAHGIDMVVGVLPFAID